MSDNDKTLRPATELVECQFCHKKKAKNKMVKTGYGLYCRQCWLDHYC